MEDQTQNTEELAFDNRIELGELKAKVNAIRNEISKVIVGQRNMIDLLIVSLLANGHVILEGVPGVAKTISAKILAKAIETDFSRIQFTPDLMPSDILGTSIFNIKTSEFEFKKGPIFSNFILIDEINRAPAKTQSALFEIMEERQVTIDGKQHKLQPPFIVIATQNPIEQEGTYQLPEAQLDRFLFKINIDYPSIQEEIEIITREHQLLSKDKLQEIQKILHASEIIKFQEIIKHVVVEENIIRYIAEIVLNTRTNSFLYMGASPRASIALLNASKAFAAINGRDFVTPEDIKEIAVAVLQHRIIVSPDKEMEGITAKQIIHQIIETIEIPR